MVIDPARFASCWGADACMLDRACEFYPRCDLTRQPDDDDDDDETPLECSGGLTALHPDPQYGEVWHCPACGRDYADE